VPIVCQPRPEAGKLTNLHEKVASLQVRDSGILIDVIDRKARGGTLPEKTLNQ
jgi:hypothetical protein